MSRRAGRFLVAAAVCVAWWAVLPGTRADSPEAIFDQANTAYEQGHYREAAEGYRRVIRFGVQDPRVEYNLGNSEYRLGHLGQAILHYRRALRLDPVDRDIRANLNLAESRCLDRVEPPETAAPLRWILAAQNRVGADRQAIAALVLLWVLCAIVAWFASRPRGWTPAAGWLLAAAAVLFLVITVSWYVTWTRASGATEAVILEPVVEVLAGPGENNPTLFTAHEGLAVEVRAERQGWWQISLPNGLNGWIRQEAAEAVR